MTNSINNPYTIEQLEEITTDPHCNPVWRQLLNAMRDLNGILENVPEAAQYHKERQQWQKE